MPEQVLNSPHKKFNYIIKGSTLSLKTAWPVLILTYIAAGHPQQAPLGWKKQLQGLLYSTGAS